MEKLENAINSLITPIGISMEELVEKNHSKNISQVRNIVYYILHCDMGYSFNKIARFFNRCDREIKYRVAQIKFMITHFSDDKECY